MLTLTPFPVNSKNTHQTDVETSKRKKKKKISEHSLMFPYWKLSFANVHSMFTPREHLRLFHALLCDCYSQVQQA